MAMIERFSEAIAGYIIQGVLLENGPWTWYRALKRDVRCCIKVYRGSHNSEASAILNHEKYLLSLVNDARVPRPIEVSENRTPPFLVLEELLGFSLAQFTMGRLFPIE